MQKAWQQVGKLLLTPLLSSLFRDVAEFPQHFQKYLLLQRAKEKGQGQLRSGKEGSAQLQSILLFCLCGTN